VRKIILLEHLSLDGYLAGPKGEMDWIRVDDELWQHMHPIIDEADAVIWGRVTYQMMHGYWPTAADSPNASEHDKHHGRWVNAATKIVFSNSLQGSTWPNTRHRADLAFAELPEIEKRQIRWENAAKLYSLESTER